MKSEASERIKDIVTAAALLAVGVGGFLFINSKGAPVTEGPGGLSWRSLPFIYSGLLIGFTLIYAALSMIGLVKALGAEGGASRPSSPPAELAHERLTNVRRLATVACLVAYAATLPMFGFAVTTPLLLFVLFYVFGRTSLAQNLMLALVGGLALWVLFVGILKLPLRGGLWDPLTPFLSNFLRSMGL
jgi:hypothetical protein